MNEDSSNLYKRVLKKLSEAEVESLRNFQSKKPKPKKENLRKGDTVVEIKYKKVDNPMQFILQHSNENLEYQLPVRLVQLQKGQRLNDFSQNESLSHKIIIRNSSGPQKNLCINLSLPANPLTSMDRIEQQNSVESTPETIQSIPQSIPTQTSQKLSNKYIGVRKDLFEERTQNVNKKEKDLSSLRELEQRLNQGKTLHDVINIGRKSLENCKNHYLDKTIRHLNTRAKQLKLEHKQMEKIAEKTIQRFEDLSKKKAIPQYLLKINKKSDTYINKAKCCLLCSFCGKSAKKYCCYLKYYCSYECQLSDWPSHSNDCTQHKMVEDDPYLSLNPHHRAILENESDEEDASLIAASRVSPTKTSFDSAPPFFKNAIKSEDSNGLSDRPRQSKGCTQHKMVEDDPYLSLNPHHRTILENDNDKEVASSIAASRVSPTETSFYNAPPLFDNVMESEDYNGLSDLPSPPHHRMVEDDPYLSLNSHHRTISENDSNKEDAFSIAASRVSPTETSFYHDPQLFDKVMESEDSNGLSGRPSHLNSFKQHRIGEDEPYPHTRTILKKTHKKSPQIFDDLTEFEDSNCEDSNIPPTEKPQEMRKFSNTSPKIFYDSMMPEESDSVEKCLTKIGEDDPYPHTRTILKKTHKKSPQIFDESSTEFEDSNCEDSNIPPTEKPQEMRKFSNTSPKIFYDSMMPEESDSVSENCLAVIFY